MRRGTQAAGFRSAGLAAFLLLVALLAHIRPVVAQEGGNQAGLVVQFEDGSVFSACVDLGSDGQATGEEVLRGSGLSAVIDYGSGFGGGTVCKIGNQGCAFPAQACFCQCTMKPGDPCLYWSYFHQLDGQWRYANTGASTYTVGPGDVEGWAWGPGSAGAGVFPPLIGFEQICNNTAAPILPEPTSTSILPSATNVPMPSSTATVVQPATPSVPTATPSASASATSTAQPSVTPSPKAFPTSTGTSSPRAPAASPTPSRTGTVTRTPILALLATATLERVSEATRSATSQAVAAGSEDAPLTLPSATAGSGDAATTSNYVAFGLLLVLLVGGLILFRIRR